MSRTEVRPTDRNFNTLMTTVAGGLLVTIALSTCSNETAQPQNETPASPQDIETTEAPTQDELAEVLTDIKRARFSEGEIGVWVVPYAVESETEGYAEPRRFTEVNGEVTCGKKVDFGYRTAGAGQQYTIDGQHLVAVQTPEQEEIILSEDGKIGNVQVGEADCISFEETKGRSLTRWTLGDNTRIVGGLPTKYENDPAKVLDPLE